MEVHVYPMGVHRKALYLFSKIISFAFFILQRTSNPMNFPIAENNL